MDLWRWEERMAMGRIFYMMATKDFLEYQILIKAESSRTMYIK